MTPDLKRLCEAAERAHSEVNQRAHDLFPYETEAIVRAVLTELREVSDECLDRGGLETSFYKPKAAGSMNERCEVAKVTLIAMIDHILAGPATA